MCRTVGGLTGKFKRRSIIYHYFARGWQDEFDFSDEMKVELFNSESFGTPVSDRNGFALGKKWMDVTIAMWKEDIRKGLLFIDELYEDQNYPHWWLDSIFKMDR